MSGVDFVKASLCRRCICHLNLLSKTKNTFGWKWQRKQADKIKRKQSKMWISGRNCTWIKGRPGVRSPLKFFFEFYCYELQFQTEFLIKETDSRAFSKYQWKGENMNIIVNKDFFLISSPKFVILICEAGCTFACVRWNATWETKQWPSSLLQASDTLSLKSEH